MLNCTCFIYIGAWLPFAKFTAPDLGITPGRLIALSAGIMFLRRIPAVLMLYKFIPEIASWKEALFCGHFGPVSAFIVRLTSETSWNIDKRLGVLLDGRWSRLHIHSRHPQASRA